MRENAANASSKFPAPSSSWPRRWYRLVLSSSTGTRASDAMDHRLDEVEDVLTDPALRDFGG
jgi:hypothetical protein